MMELRFTVTDFAARACGLSTADQWRQAALDGTALDASAKNPKPSRVPMMAARRLSQGCRMAVDAGLELASRSKPDAVIYSSRSGELEHNLRILDAVDSGNPCSPTDFSMSVHNCAVGNFTILSHLKIPAFSTSAGPDTFLEALAQACSLLLDGCSRVLLVDFDSAIPEFFATYADPAMPLWPYAAGFMIESGNRIEVSEDGINGTQPSMPESLSFLLGLIKGSPFEINGFSHCAKVSGRIGPMDWSSGAA